MSTLGVFLALGGVSYAATALPANSVGTAQIQGKAVTSAKVADGAIGLTQMSAAAALALRGPIGATGARGATGAQGLRGLIGATGETGSPGTPGAKGDTGLQGPKGDTGAKGDTGLQGPLGDTGAKGDTGLQGPKGDTGATGPVTAYVVGVETKGVPSACVAAANCEQRVVYGGDAVTSVGMGYGVYNGNPQANYALVLNFKRDLTGCVWRVANTNTFGGGFRVDIDGGSQLAVTTAYEIGDLLDSQYYTATGKHLTAILVICPQS